MGCWGVAWGVRTLKVCAGEMTAITYAYSSRADSKSESEESEAAASLLFRFRLRAARRSASTCLGDSTAPGPRFAFNDRFFITSRPLFASPIDDCPALRLAAGLGCDSLENRPIERHCRRWTLQLGHFERKTKSFCSSVKKRDSIFIQKCSVNAGAIKKFSSIDGPLSPVIPIPNWRLGSKTPYKTECSFSLPCRVKAPTDRRLFRKTDLYPGVAAF